MSHAEEPRLETQVARRHHEGRPYHYAAPSQDERIRRIFGLSDEASLPAVNDFSLATYYEYLAQNLVMPFDALHCPAGNEARQLIHYLHVIELCDPRQVRLRNLYGLFCRAQNAKEAMDLPLADLGVREDNPNCQLIDDYAYWFVNWR
jgi:hypothetical protein